MDNSPLLEYLKNIVAGYTKTERAFVISSTNVNTGEIPHFTDKTISLKDIPDVASSAIPVVF